MHSDFLIIGGGIIGLTVAQRLSERYPSRSVTIIEKEDDVARHASGRNSGVLHAGFYYTADSLKARFCRDGSRLMRTYCDENGLKVNPCGKLVVATTPGEVEGLRELKRRGDVNGVTTELISSQDAEAIEPNVQTLELALWSPDTATVDPAAVCAAMRVNLRKKGIIIHTHTPYVRRLEGNRIQAGESVLEGGVVINCAGLYADAVARDFGFCRDFTIIPFKGIYLKYAGPNPPLRTNIYPVPNLNNPFLGVHFTITVDGYIKIGPTAIPAFWRENYQGFDRFSAKEAAEIIRWESVLFAKNAFGFRKLAFEELRKYQKSHLTGLAAKLVKRLDPAMFSHWSTPGIRAQLLNTKTLSLVQDFVVEGDGKSIHVLNAVSPAFTCSLAFSDWLVTEWVK